MNKSTAKSRDSAAAYRRQDRGDETAYQAYLKGMDATAQSKVAYTTAHFPPRGVVADMGSGSGKPTFELASLHPGLKLVGVDINPEMVARATRQYRRANLGFVEGDVAGRIFPDRSLDGILNSSVLHHVSSFNDFDVERVKQGLANQVAALKPGGVLVLRDFVIPRGPTTVRLDLPAHDGNAEEGAPGLSTAALFERFARDFRSSENREGPVPHRELDCPRAGHRRFELSHRAAAEFLLRKDYRQAWDVELQEEYMYMSQLQFEQTLQSLGMRVVTSMEIHNPWIVQNRFEGKAFLSSVEGEPLPFPPTNYLIVGEKVPSDRGVLLEEASSKVLDAPRFLEQRTFVHQGTGERMELVSRPHPTVDLLPYFVRDGQVMVLAKHGFPRPILNAKAGGPELHASAFSGYTNETISAMAEDQAADEKTVVEALARRGQVPKEAIQSVGDPVQYYPSPGGLNERVVARAIEIAPFETRREVRENYTGFSSAGAVQPVDAQQLLRACQVGGVHEARLELNIYHLLLKLGRSPGPWIDARVTLRAQEVPLQSIEPAAAVLSPEPRATFRELPAEKAGRPGFLEVREGTFVEKAADGRVLAKDALEYVVPRRLSANTASAIPVVRSDGRIFVGIEERDLPAIQQFSGSSAILTAPAWRLPKNVDALDQLDGFIQRRLVADFGAKALRTFPLGGSYYPSPGITPEKVYPLAVEVDAATMADAGLRWVALDDLISQRDLMVDAHLMTAAFRLAHAMGALEPAPDEGA